MTESMQEIQYTEAFIRRISRQTIVRNLGLLYLIAMLFLSASISIGFVLGSHDWFFGFTTTVFALAILVPWLQLHLHTQSGLQRLRQLDRGKLSVDILAARLHLASALGNTDMPLARINKLLRFPGYWVLMSDRAIVMSLPISTVPSEVQQRWLQEFRDVGTNGA
jgi:hypothetical protein